MRQNNFDPWSKRLDSLGIEIPSSQTESNLVAKRRRSMLSSTVMNSVAGRPMLALKPAVSHSRSSVRAKAKVGNWAPGRHDHFTNWLVTMCH